MLYNSQSFEIKLREHTSGVCRGQRLHPVTDSWHADGDYIFLV